MARIDAGLPSLTAKLISCARFWLMFGARHGRELGEERREVAEEVELRPQALELPEVSDEPA